jgi:hypothetical protein
MGDKFRNKAEFHHIFLVIIYLYKRQCQNKAMQQKKKKKKKKNSLMGAIFWEGIFRDKILNGFFLI